MSTHNIGFYLTKIIFELSSNTHLIEEIRCIFDDI